MNNVEIVSSFEEQMQRIWTVTGLRSISDLAEYFGTRPAAVSDAKRRRLIPTGWLRHLTRALLIDPQWILTGQGERFINVPKRGRLGLDFMELLQSCKKVGAAGASSSMANIMGKDEAPEIIHSIPSKVLVEELLRRIIIVEPEQLSS